MCDNCKRAGDGPLRAEETDAEYLLRCGWERCSKSGEWIDPQRREYRCSTGMALIFQRERDRMARRLEVEELGSGD